MKALLLPLALAVEYNYCSLQHSALVKTEVKNYFTEVFRGYNVPMSDTCPFGQLSRVDSDYNLPGYEKKRHAAYSKTECGLCNKSFKQEDYFEWHYWSQHVE